MLIDWFTVGAQAVNFIVLVWLLKRFLYKPVLREQRIAGELAAADRQKAEATASQDALQAKNKAFDDERAALLAKATLDAKSQGERLLAEARTAAEALAAQQRAALEGETTNLSRELTRLAAAESISIARAALQTLAGSDLDARIGEVFVKRVRALESKARESFGAALKGSNAGCVVVSSFPIEERERAEIQTALNETFSADIQLRFETSSRVIGGIELEAGGQRLSWSVADYLKSLDEKVGALLRTGDTAARAAAPAAADQAAASARPASVAATPAPVAAAAA
jgi:F-type H+-transporting ATPase subunit b